MTYYPVYIPTLNRYEHFKACVESLARCTHADKTELVISLDYPPSEKYIAGWQKIREYLPTIQGLGFGKVTIFEQTKNLGAYENATLLWHYCSERYDACIVSEDDNIVAPAFLDFINCALEKFRCDARIVNVCGYTQERSGGCGQGSCLLTEDCCAWGMGLWVDKHRKSFGEYLQLNWGMKLLHRPLFVLRFLLTYPIGFVMFWKMVRAGKKYGDLCRTAYNFAHGTYQLRPTKSLVRNCGQDGSGLHCGVNEAAGRQEISEAKTFDFGTEPPRVSHKGLFWQGWESSRFAKFMPWLKR